MSRAVETTIIGDESDDGRLADAIANVVGTWDRVRDGAEHFFRSVGSTVTVLGWSVIAFVAVGFAAGYLLGWGEFVAIAWAGLLLLVVSSAYLLGRSSIRIRLSLPLARIVVGENAPGEVLVHNPTRRHSPSVRVEVPVGEGLAEFHMPGLARGAQTSEIFVVPALHRGIIQVGPVRTIRGDPVGLFRRELTWSERSDLYVHPRTIPIPTVSTGFVRDLEGTATREITASDVSFHALREYMPGDDRRYIHWRSSARTGRFMIRQFEETRRSHIMVALSTSRLDYSTDEEFELAVSAAGSLGVYAIRDARTVSVIVSGPRRTGRRRTARAVRGLSTASRTRLLDDLTVLALSDTASDLVDLARLASESASSATVAFLVCGAPTTVTSLRQAAASLPAGVEVVAVVCDPGVVPSLRRVSDLSVLTIGFLDDLQKTLARTAAT